MASAGNIGALLAVGDRPEGNEMAKVHAAKALETMLDQSSERTGIGRAATQQRVPGLQIVNSASPYWRSDVSADDRGDAGVRGHAGVA